MKKEELRQEAIKKVIQVLKDGYTYDYSYLDEIFAKEGQSISDNTQVLVQAEALRG